MPVRFHYWAQQKETLYMIISFCEKGGQPDPWASTPWGLNKKGNSWEVWKMLKSKDDYLHIMKEIEVH